VNDLLRRLLALPPQASTFALRVDSLHYFVILTTMAGATVVFALSWYFTVRYRQRAPGELTPRIQATAPGEATLIVGILGLFILWWVIGNAQYDRMNHPPPDAATVHLVAKQWMWEFAYADGTSSLDTLTVPVGRPVRLVMTSRDVIHSFYVPAFRIKHDVVPGHDYATWFEPTVPGDYPIRCAEYCGTNHSRMLGTVRVLSAPDYAEWLQARVRSDAVSAAGARLGPGDLASVGRDVAVRRACVACHTVDGQTHIGPSWAGLFGSSVALTDGRHVEADGGYLTRSMMDPMADVVAGFAPVMPTYRGILSEPEVAALVEYIQSLRDRPVTPSVALPPVTPRASAEPAPAGPGGGPSQPSPAAREGGVP
jgi:cytochrome c oxidase subunit 2